jgi:uncharacterized protein YbbK (DUF523 family)
MKLLVSSCLIGINTRYDGKNKLDNKLLSFLLKNNIDFYPLCAEQLGGLTTPREPSEIENGYTAKDVLNGKGRVLTKDREEVTKNFVEGANEVLEFCKSVNITHAVLAQRSPSCGYSKVYDGSFEGNLIEGKGILAQLLEDNGIIVVEDINDLNIS